MGWWLQWLHSLPSWSLAALSPYSRLQLGERCSTVLPGALLEQGRDCGRLMAARLWVSVAAATAGMTTTLPDLDC